jgi:hypothetical protein
LNLSRDDDTVVIHMARSTRKPHRQDAGASTLTAPRWLLLIHQIPPKPDYLRVKIGRRLQRIGAVAIKNSVYVLPPSAESLEDFQWIVREIEEGGGDAFVSDASLVGEGLTDDAVRARFDSARNEDYRAIGADARLLLELARPPQRKGAGAKGAAKPAATPQRLENELAKLRRRYEAASAIDFFGASEQAATAELFTEIQRELGRRVADAPKRASARAIEGATWVTRRDVHVDRIASAWLIRRFIDRRPKFQFVDPARHAHGAGELRFDMFEAEYTHVGDACTFETLVSTFIPDDDALRQIAEIVHDVDCKDDKFRRAEAPGLARLIVGIVALREKDEDRVPEGAALFDVLYAAFGGAPRT